MKKLNDKLLNWASILEPDTLAQAQLTSQMQFIWPHLALMPDAHPGKGSTVGSGIPTLGAIMPAAVGVDIGCGMIAVRTQYTSQDIGAHIGDADKTLRGLRQSIERAIPLSAGAYNHD